MSFSSFSAPSVLPWPESPPSPRQSCPEEFASVASSLTAASRPRAWAGGSGQPRSVVSIHRCVIGAMRSMEQPRHSHAERILAVIGLTNGDFVARIRILMLGTSLLPGQASCGGAIPIASMRGVPQLKNTLGNRALTELGCQMLYSVGARCISSRGGHLVTTLPPSCRLSRGQLSMWLARN